MKSTIFAASLALALAPLAVSSPAEAKGCLKGAAVGAVAGHHGVLGAIGGCAVGHHMANKSNQSDNNQNSAASSQQQQQQQQPKNNP
jgi:hypothetical protein